MPGSEPLETRAETTPDASSPGGADPERRRFFRRFAAETLQTVAAVAGAAGALRDSSAEAAREILGDDPLGERLLAAPDAREAAGAPFRTPYRAEPDRLVVVDQRALPQRIVERTCETAPELAALIREGAVRGGPVLGQLAAYGLALTAARVGPAKPYARRATLRGAANALVRARPGAASVEAAVRRSMARYEALGELTADGAAVADALRAEADAIAFEALYAHGRLADAGAALLPEVGDRAVQVLTLGDVGAMGGGQVGTALAVVGTAVGTGRRVHVLVAESRPALAGARILAWELANTDVPHSIVADAAAGRLLADGRVDIVLAGADRIALDGAVLGPVGTYPLAVLADRHAVPFVVCAPTPTIDTEAPGAVAFRPEDGPPEELLTIAGRRVAPSSSAARNLLVDVTPAELVRAFVTDEGVVRPPFESALLEAVEAARRRREPPAVRAGHAIAEPA